MPLAHSVHMCLEQVRDLALKLFDQGTLDEQSALYLAHINYGSTHKENVDAVERMNFPVKTIVTYDGIKIL